MLTQEELDKLSGAEELFRSPIPVQFVSSDELMPAPQTAQQKEFEVRIEALRRMEIPEEIQKKYGLAPMGAAATLCATPT